MARFCPLFSGSGGNSYYVGDGEGGVLIDAGVSAKRLGQALTNADIDINTIKGIFVTHEHSDHIAGLRVFATRHKLKVYASEGTLDALSENDTLNGRYEAFVLGSLGIEMGNLKVTPFHTSHDCRESYGYVVELSDGRKLAIATDLGYVSRETMDAIMGCDFVVIESNHDVRILQNGPYPYVLKRRILSETGHLSNDACSGILPELLKSGASRFVLGHLSKENNMPELAKQTALASLNAENAKEGIDFILSVAPVEYRGKVTVF